MWPDIGAKSRPIFSKCCAKSGQNKGFFFNKLALLKIAPKMTNNFKNIAQSGHTVCNIKTGSFVVMQFICVWKLVSCSGCYKTFLGGNLENLPLNWNCKNKTKLFSISNIWWNLDFLQKVLKHLLLDPIMWRNFRHKF